MRLGLGRRWPRRPSRWRRQTFPDLSVWTWLRDPRSLVAVVAIVLATWSLLRPDPPMPVTRISVDFSEDQGVANRGMFDISRDGSLLVYIGPGATGEVGQLWARGWAALEATPIQDTEGANFHAISPDGQEVAYAPGSSIRVVPIQGGVPPDRCSRLSALLCALESRWCLAVLQQPGTGAESGTGYRWPHRASDSGRYRCWRRLQHLG